MPPYAAFPLGIHCLPKYLFTVIIIPERIGLISSVLWSLLVEFKFNPHTTVLCPLSEKSLPSIY